MRRFQWVMDWVIDSRFRFGRGRHCFRGDNNLYWWNDCGENRCPDYSGYEIFGKFMR